MKLKLLLYLYNVNENHMHIFKEQFCVYSTAVNIQSYDVDQAQLLSMCIHEYVVEFLWWCTVILKIFHTGP